MIFHWYGDAFALPQGAHHLVRSEACQNQAFRFGDSTYGLQFHLEVDAVLIERWLRTPVHLREITALGNTVDPEQVRTDTSLYMARSTELSGAVFGEFIDRSYSPRRRVLLPSR